MRLRLAESGDAGSLAELIYLADLAHYPTSGYALSLGGTPANQIEEISRLTTTQAQSQFHFSHFDVAEADDGTLAAAVAGFDRGAASEHAGSALLEIGWDRARIQVLVDRLSPFDDCYPAEEPHNWTIEHVATFEQYRGRGLARQLLERAIDRGRGRKQAVVDVFTGNDKALALYHAAGFRTVATFGHDPLRQIFNRDPLIRLERKLG